MKQQKDLIKGWWKNKKMAKKEFKVYMEQKDYNALLEKCKQMGYEGRGSLSAFFQFVAQNQIIFVDDNIKTLLRAVKL